MEKVADLHCHTNISDGSLPVCDVVELAKLKGLSGLAITDHDSISGIKSAEIECKNCNIEYIKGVEVSSFDYQRKRKVHILCYSFEQTDEFLSFLSSICNERKKAFYKALPIVLEKFDISQDMIEKVAQNSDGRFKQQVMHVLINAGYTTEFFGELFNYLYGDNGISDYEVEYPTVKEVIEIIHRAKGLAVMAHPRVYNSFELLDELVEEKLLDGIEIRHTRNKPEDEQYLKTIAQKNNLLCTGGTDFHGMYCKRPLQIGTCTTDWETFLKIKNHNE